MRVYGTKKVCGFCGRRKPAHCKKEGVVICQSCYSYERLKDPEKREKHRLACKAYRKKI